MLGKEKLCCGNTLFVDVDYPQLINKKAEIILATPQLHDLLGEVRTSANSETVRLRSHSYLAVGCDLRDLEQLQCVLSEELELSRCIVLLTAEVSVTYMDVEAADALISWAANFEDGAVLLGPPKMGPKVDTSHSLVLSPGTVPSKRGQSSLCENYDKSLQQITDSSKIYSPLPVSRRPASSLSWCKMDSRNSKKLMGFME